MQIREATSSDWAQIWPFFAEIVAAGETYTYDRDISYERAKMMWMADPPAHTVVAVDGDEFLGTAKTGANHMGPASHIATASFMVAPAARGRGVGRALGEHVLDLARADGYRAMQFNAVVETNTTAVALWQSLGFKIMTTLPEAFHHPTKGYVGLHIMYRKL
jgi:GNAT superfamily N-acetyltransferase